MSKFTLLAMQFQNMLLAVDTPEVTEAKAQAKNIIDSVLGIVSWVAVTGVALVLSIIWVGYLFSDKDATALEKAKKRTVGTVFALAIVGGITLITNAILSIVF